MKKVAVIQDLSSFGKCSLTAAIPVLSVMGVQAVPLPTAILTAQTEYHSYYCEDLTHRMKEFTNEWTKLDARFEGIQTGFVTGKEQIRNIMDFLDVFYKEETMLLTDPVMGDRGEMYDVFSTDLVAHMRELAKRADVITPNITECCLLTGMSYERLHSYASLADYMKAVEEAARTLQDMTNAKVIVTGLHPPAEADRLTVGNLYMDAGHSFHRLHDYNGRSYSGTGDLFSSVIMGGLMRGQEIGGLIALAEDFLTAAIDATSKEEVPRQAGVNFELFLRMLL